MGIHFFLFPGVSLVRPPGTSVLSQAAMVQPKKEAFPLTPTVKGHTPLSYGVNTVLVKLTREKLTCPKLNDSRPEGGKKRQEKLIS